MRKQTTPKRAPAKKSAPAEPKKKPTGIIEVPAFAHTSTVDSRNCSEGCQFHETHRDYPNKITHFCALDPKKKVLLEKKYPKDPEGVARRTEFCIKAAGFIAAWKTRAYIDHIIGC